MFINALKMAKSTWKLIIRSKGFIVFGLVLPILATLFINLWFRTPTVESTESVYELSSIDEQIVYQVDFSRYTVKVYDTVMNDRTDNICNNLNSAGMFQIYRADATALTDEEIRENYEKTAMNERIGAVVVLRENEECSGTALRQPWPTTERHTMLRISPLYQVREMKLTTMRRETSHTVWHLHHSPSYSEAS